MTEELQVVAPGAGAAEPRQLCPKCQSARVYRSHRRSRWEGLRSWFKVYPYRCHACDYRYLAKSGAAEKAAVKDARPDLRRRQARRMARGILIAGICVAIFLLFLHYLTRPAPFGGDAQ